MPHHHAVPSELARVTRPGGRLAFSAWTPEGTVGGMFERLASFQPPPPEGAGSPLQWGSEAHVRALLGGAFELRVDRRVSEFEASSSGEAWVLFSTKFGPTKTMLENLPPERAGEFKEMMVGLLEENRQADGRIVDPREYLLVIGLRR